LADLIRDEQIGLQYQPRDVESLVENIQWLAANPEARKTMAVRVAKLFDERFSSDVIYPGLVGYLEKIVQNRSSSQPAADD
jgi:glycosyltransferase involved in cell wall biosynthesis